MSNPNPQIQVSGDKAAELAKRIEEEGNRQLAELKPTDSSGALDSGQSAHSLDGKDKPFDQKIYLFPESYNALRRELMTNWPHLWAMSGWFMAHQAEDFVAIMNDATGLKLQFDTQKVEATCEAYYRALRKQRGLSF